MIDLWIIQAICYFCINYWLIAIYQMIYERLFLKTWYMQLINYLLICLITYLFNSYCIIWRWRCIIWFFYGFNYWFLIFVAIWWLFGCGFSDIASKLFVFDLEASGLVLELLDWFNYLFICEINYWFNSYFWL